MEDDIVLRQRIKKMMVENLMLQISPEEIGDEQPLFGPGSVGLDSVDALQLVVALEDAFNISLTPADVVELKSYASAVRILRRHGVSIDG